MADQAAPAPAAAPTGVSNQTKPPSGASTASQAEAPGAADQTPSKPGNAGPGDFRQLVLALAQAVRDNGRKEGGLSREIDALRKEIDAPGRVDQAMYRTRVAYALQDVERIAGPLAIDAALRQELQARSATYPGLENERMRHLVAMTSSLQYRQLAVDIRKAAGEVTWRADQSDAAAMQIIERLENRVRQTPKVAEKAAPTVLPGNGANSASSATTVQQPGAEQTTTSRPIAAQPSAAPMPQPVQVVEQQRQPGRVVLDIMAALRRTEPEPPAPWDRQLTPMGDRINRYTATLRAGAEEQAFRAAERSGDAALAAMKAFSDGPGSVLMTRIRDAAKIDPNGITGVLAEMRTGGRYAGLRQDFNVALQQDKAFAAAYERAAGGVARFGTDRVEVESIAAGRIDSAAIAGRFLKLDAEIGKAARELPGKTEGKSFADELSQRAVEIVRKAADAVQNVFTRIRASIGPSAAPS
jgi:hypothetical protein